MRSSNETSKLLFIKHLLQGEVITSASARGLIELAEFAVSIRAWEELAQIGARLCALPVGAGYYDVGLLYTALALNRTAGGREQAERLLRGLADCSSSAIKARSLLALGSNCLVEGDSAQALEYYHKADSLDKKSPLTIFYSAMLTIAAHSDERRHGQTLDALNSISKLADYVGRFYRPYLFNYHNSVAVELTALGHSDEARRVITPALASPYAPGYSEWRETDEDAARDQASGNVVSISKGSPQLSIGEKRDRCLVEIRSGSDALIDEIYPIVTRRAIPR